ncbi:hypothetical protein RJ641_007876 [Dillenia turbinata]|uniref:Uncharacterized protein n=1 Tax=Dillenia turbinata TaxID=194707 RepID=A0AAN8VER9_9MAGN
MHFELMRPTFFHNCRSPAYTMLPHLQRPSFNSDGTAQASTSQPQHQHFSVPGVTANSFLPQFAPTTLAAFQIPAASVMNTDKTGDDSNIFSSQLEFQRTILEQQIEVLRKQLDLLPKPKPDEGTEAPKAVSDVKGKSAASSSPSTSDCGRHGEIEEFDS